MKQHHYPAKLYIQDALKFLQYSSLEYVSLIHASPPCQAYSKIRFLTGREYSDLVDVTREALEATGKPWIIENVPQSPLRDPLVLCGTHFNLGAFGKDGKWHQLRRHRWFESNMELPDPPRACHHRGQPVGVYGKGGGVRRTSFRGYVAIQREASEALKIEGMTLLEMAQVIPPAYTRYLGQHVKSQVLNWEKS